MSDTVYRLIVDMSARGSLEPQLAKMQGQAKGLDTSFKSAGASLNAGLSAAANSIERIGDKVFDYGKKMAMFGAAGAAAGAAFGLHLNKQMENASISLASIFKAEDLVGSMPEGLKLAGDTIRDMRKDAAQLPGEFSDLMRFFQLGATPGFQLGASVKQLEKMSAHGMAAAFTTGVPMDQAAREFSLLLQGRAGAHNVFGSMLGLRADSFNQLQGGDRLKAIESALAKHEDSIEYSAKSWEGAVSTLKDNAAKFSQNLTAPLYRTMGKTFHDANKWFDAHEQQVNHFADAWGTRLAHSFDVGRDRIMTWYPAIVTFGEHAREEIRRIWIVAAPIADKLGSMGKEFLADPKLFDHLKHFALLYGGIKVGGAVAPLASPLAAGLGGLLSGGGGLAGLGAGAGELATAFPYAAAAVGTFALAAEGAAHALADPLSKYHDQAVTGAQYIADRSFVLGNEMVRLDGNTRDLRDAMGTAAIYIGGAFVDSASQWAKFTNDMIEAGDRLVRWMNLPRFGETEEDERARRKFDASYAADMAALFADANKSAVGHANRYTGFAHGMGDTARGAGREKTTKRGAGGGGGGTTINQQVKIVVTSNQDPSRIARLTSEHLANLTKFPTSSPAAKNWSTARTGE